MKEDTREIDNQRDTSNARHHEEEEHGLHCGRQLSTLIHTRKRLFAAGCKCADANHFSTFQVADVKDLRNQLHGAPDKAIDTLLLGCFPGFRRDSFLEDGSRKRIK